MCLSVHTFTHGGETMTRPSRIILLLLIIAISFSRCICEDNPTGAGGGVENGNGTTEQLDMLLYRFGADLNSANSTEDDFMTIFVGDAGIVLNLLISQDRPYPIYFGVAYDFNGIEIDNPAGGEEEIWIAGDAPGPGEPGVIWHYNSTTEQWSMLNVIGTGDVTCIASSYAVTSEGHILLKSGSSYTSVFQEPSGTPFRAIMESVHTIAVGDNGLIYYFDGSSWIDESIEGGPDFKDVYTNETGEAIAVGGNEIWRRGASDWSLVHTVSGGELNTVWARSGSDYVWAAGTNGIHYRSLNGIDWSQLDGFGQDIDIRHGYEGKYLVGENGIIFHGDPGWHNLGFTNTEPWSDIHASAAGDLYAVNGDTLQWWNGEDWQLESVAATQHTSRRMFSLQVKSASDIWALGTDGFEYYLLHYDGASWGAIESGSTFLVRSLWCDPAGSDTVMIAHSYGRVVCYDGTTANGLIVDDDLAHFNDLDGPNAHDLFVVGDGGTIFHYNGSEWTDMSISTTLAFRAISGPYAVGDGGLIAIFNGSSWQIEDAGVTSDLSDVWYGSDTNIWAVGDGGVVINYNGNDWTEYKRSLYTVDLLSVYGAGPHDIWIGGEDGYLIRRNPQ